MRDQRYSVTLVDQNNYSHFAPLVYQVATSFLEASSISYPFRKLFRGESTIRFRLGVLLWVDPASHTCYLNNGEIGYDYLVFATGTETNYYGYLKAGQSEVEDRQRFKKTLQQQLEWVLAQAQVPLFATDTPLNSIGGFSRYQLA